MNSEVICAACGVPTLSGSRCGACGADPQLLGRFVLLTRRGHDRRGTLYDGLDEAGEPIRARVAAPPAAERVERWRTAARGWQRFKHAGIARPVAWGETPDGRWVRVERAVEGQPLRRMDNTGAMQAVLERLLDLLATLHAAGTSHGGVGVDALVRRADGGIMLCDFAPDPGVPADDVLGVAQLSRALCSAPFHGPAALLLDRMRAEEPARRPSAAEAREILHRARRAQPTAVVQVTPDRPTPHRLRALLIVLLIATAGYYWWSQRRTHGIWEGALTGRVDRVSGTGPTRMGADCTIDIEARIVGRDNCRVVIECGGTTIYGGGEYGLARCEGDPPRAQDGAPSAEDGDPLLDLKADMGRIEVRDIRHVQWSVGIALDTEFAEE